MRKDKFKYLIDLISKQNFVKSTEKLIGANQNEISIKTVNNPLASLIISSLWNRKPTFFFILTNDIKSAEDWFDNLQLFVDKENIALLLKPKQSRHFDDNDLSKGWLLEGLAKIQKNENPIIITTPDIFNVAIPNTNDVKNSWITLEVNEKIDFEELTGQLFLNGFDRKDFLANQGDIAIRGGIVDIFPIGWDNPLRFEFWGDVIESIREFDIISQRSIKEHRSIEFISSVFEEENDSTYSTITDYLDLKTIMVIDSPELIIQNFEDFVIPEQFRKIYFNKLGDADIKIKFAQQTDFNSSIKKLSEEIKDLISNNYQIFLSAEGEIHLQRFKEIIENNVFNINIENPDYDIQFTDDENINWLEHTLSEGFLLPENNICIYTEHQVFNRRRFQIHKKGKKSTGSITIKELQELKIGDFIVHDDKGIGKFAGFEKITLAGSLQDCVKLRFANDDFLFVHLNYIQKIQKYSSQEGIQPKLSKLGTREWERKKARTKKHLKDIARDLIKLYAKRKMQPGFAYPLDTMWQKEFEASFIYEDTPDQAEATDEIKKDLEEQAPMDRLICGDVGFGKTEVAVRAAFKVVQAGKQVAVLVPTTILAQQHYMTFRDRLSKYPVNIEVISRFRTRKEQLKIIEDTKKGLVDILIGTHRLLSKDIDFKSLGLLIIDEEHRFGVGSKEKLKQLRVNVDTLTLTATPIPRTLNFSLLGARDLSIIETPPRNRLPVNTEIIEWNEKKISIAIMNEINRSGQVFFVTDKVQNIDELAQQLQKLLPTIKFGIAHGQMKNSELEKIMEKFVKGKFDVLITTKIIESGLDIPNANTIIINHSQNFGLAELYQLRGRVGRSNTQAFCYLIIPPVKTLKAKSLKRLQAIEEFTDLGSGFQLALRDMEIRGAGNLLGPEQSGYINDIGFELYHKILDNVVAELRAEEFSDVFKNTEYEHKHIFENEGIAIEINEDALIPGDYIESDTERFRFYKILYNVKTNSELEEITKEMKDRFGELPKQVQGLVFAVKIRIAALDTGITKVTLKSNKMILEFPNESNEEFYQIGFPLISEYISEFENAQFIQKNKRIYLELTLNNRDDAVEILWKIQKTVENSEF